jgi:hypothetical protein
MPRRKLLAVMAGLAVVVAAGTPTLAGLAVVAAAGAIVFALWPEPSSRITSENFDRRRRRKLLLGLVGVAVVVVAGVVVLWPSRITPENYERIRVGMSRAEVYAILGPPGDYSTYDAPSYEFRCLGPPPPLPMEEWLGNRARIGVFFDGAGNVASARCFLLNPVAQSPLGNLLWRAQRQWDRWFPE